MIKPIKRSDLSACLEIFHRGYETVAIEFGLTEDNSPDRGRASLSLDQLIAEFEKGTMMFGYFLNDKIVGFLGMAILDNGICNIDDIIILPGYRQHGYGTKLLAFCKDMARESGALRIRLGMIDDNKRLKKWYEENGFSNIESIKYDSAPYMVGKMECVL